MSFVFRCLAALLLTIGLCPAYGQLLKPQADPAKAGVEPSRLARIDALLQQYVDSQWMAGAVALVARDGQIIYHKAVGRHAFDGNRALQRDAIFRIASQTKAITSVAVMMLYEEGKLLLDDPVSKYIPAFAKPVVLDKFEKSDTTYSTVPARREITIRHLLTHTSGIGYAQIGSPEANAIYAKSDITAGIGVRPGRLLATDMLKLAKLPLMHQPGERFTYGLNTDVLGYLVEVVSGVSLDQFFRKRIFEPLGMKDTWFYLPADKRQRLVALHTEDSTGRLRVASSLERNGTWDADYPSSAGTYYSGGAGLVSTAYDYAIFMEMMRNGGVYNGVRLLSPKTVGMMTRPQIGNIDRGLNESFGLGFGIVTEYGSGRIGQSPGTFSWGGAFSSTYWIDPGEKIVAQLFLNQYPTTHGDIHDKFKALVYSALR